MLNQLRDAKVDAAGSCKKHNRMHHNGESGAIDGTQRFTDGDAACAVTNQVQFEAWPTALKRRISSTAVACTPWSVVSAKRLTMATATATSERANDLESRLDSLA